MHCVIFDLDGTLVDSKEAIAASINHVRAHLYRLPPLPVAAVMEALFDRPETIPRKLYGTVSYEPAAKSLFEAHYIEHVEKDVALYPHIDTMVKTLHAAGCRLYIATNGPTASSRKLVDRCGILSCFHDIVGADRVRNPKPHPEMIETILRHNVDAKYWMVGDTRNDEEAARSAGIAFIHVTWGYGPIHDDDIKKADNPLEIPSYILQ